MNTFGDYSKDPHDAAQAASEARRTKAAGEALSATSDLNDPSRRSNEAYRRTRELLDIAMLTMDSLWNTVRECAGQGRHSRT